MCNQSITSGDMPISQKKALVTPRLKKPGMDVEEPASFRPVSNISFLSKDYWKNRSWSAVDIYEKKTISSHNISQASERVIRQRRSSSVSSQISTRQWMMEKSRCWHYSMCLRRSTPSTLISYYEDCRYPSESREKLFAGSTPSFMNAPTPYRSEQQDHHGIQSSTAYPKAHASVHSCISYTPRTFRKSVKEQVLPLICTQTTFSRTRPSLPQESLQAVKLTMTALTQLSDWMKVNRLKLNQDKTQFMWIGRKQMLDKIRLDVIHAHFPDLKFLSSVNDLGVVLDENLNMEEQVGGICRSCFYHLRQIRAIRHSLSDVAARTAIQAFIMSKVDYCNAALLGLSSAVVDRVQRVMNAAARVLLKLPKFSHISARMKNELHWLPVRERIQYKLVMTTWRCITGCAPDYLQELCHLLSEITGRRQLRSSVPCRYLLAIPQARTVTMKRRAFAYAGPTSWNAVPESIRSTALVVSLATLKTQLKTVLFCLSVGS